MSLNPKILLVMKKNIEDSSYYTFFEKILYRESERVEIGADRNKITKFYKKVIDECIKK